MKSHICVYSDLSEPSREIYDIIRNSNIDAGAINVTNKATLRQILDLKIISCVPTLLQIDTQNDVLNLYHGKIECANYMKTKLDINVDTSIHGGSAKGVNSEFNSMHNSMQNGMQGNMHNGIQNTVHNNTQPEYKSSQLDSNNYSKEIRGNIIPNNLMSDDKPKQTKKISIMEQAKQMNADRENEMKIIGPPPIGM